MVADNHRGAGRARRALLDFAAVLAVVGMTTVASAAEREAFKVCAPPHSLPTSNQQQQGYENKIAKLFADSLGLPLEYEWFPQRIGFIRNTLRNDDTPDGSYKCDIVMGVPDNFELAATTQPYYRSTWTLVYVRGGALDGVKSGKDLAALPPERRQGLKIGAFDKSPAVRWMHRYGFLEQLVPYQIMSGDARRYPGRIIEEELAEGELDAAFVWGPIAGYFTQRIEGVDFTVVPMKSEPAIKFDYQIAMAVRYGEDAWKDQVNDLIDQHRDEINAILTDYGVPLLPIQAKTDGGDDDD